MDMERNTRQRAAIRDAITTEGRPLLAQEILEIAQKDVAGMSIATVYRNLNALVDAQEIQVVCLPGQNPRYESAALLHHHHFQCTRCGRVVDVFSCPGDMKSMAPAGCAVEEHDLLLYGKCERCSRERARNDAELT